MSISSILKEMFSLHYKNPKENINFETVARDQYIIEIKCKCKCKFATKHGLFSA